MNLTRYALNNRMVALAFVILIVISGLVSYLKLPQDEDPSFPIRTALVTTVFPGASPKRVEDLVSDKIEKAVQEIPEVDFIKSESREGLSVVYVQIKEGISPLQPIWDRLRRKVEQASIRLPQDVYGPFVDDEFGDVFGVVMALTGKDFSYSEMKHIGDALRESLLRLSEVAKVEIYAAQDERLYVEFNHSKLAKLRVSPMYLRSILTSQNIVIPGGDVTLQDERIVLEPTGAFESVEDIRQTIIKLPTRDDLLYLQDIANVSRGYVDPPETLMTHNGLSALGISISMRKGGNVLLLGQQIDEAVRKFKENTPIGLELDILAFKPARVVAKVTEFLGNLAQSVAIVVAVMIAALGLKTGLLVGALIPLTILFTIAIMPLVGVGIDQVSLAALLVSLGMLVDNSIVISESILVQVRKGKSVFDAAIASTQELRRPLLVASLTTATAFLPVFLADTTVGEYTAPLFKVVSVALISSWVLSLTVIPVLCYWFLSDSTQEDSRVLGWLYKWYQAFLSLILSHRTIVLITITALFALAMWGFQSVPRIFFPASDRDFLVTELELPPATKIERTREVVDALDRFIDTELAVKKGRERGVESWASFVGSGAPRFILNYEPSPPAQNYAYVLMNTTSYRHGPELQRKIEDFMTEQFPESFVVVKPVPYGPPVTSPFAIRISGADTDVIAALADSLKSHLRHRHTVTAIRDDWGARTKKLVVDVDQARARRAGITSQDIAVSLQTTLRGVNIADYHEQEKLIPIVLRAVAEDRKDINRLETLNVTSLATGVSVPLKQVADIQLRWQPSRVIRRDRVKTITVKAELAPGVTAAAVMDDLQPWLNSEFGNLPHGYAYETGGEMESSGKANIAILKEIPIAALIIFMLLIVQFNSFRKPLILAAIVPMGMIGVVVGLLLNGESFGFMTLLGVVSLSGIIINNANVLMDRIRIEIEEEHRPPFEAIMIAARMRLRPVFLTTATTVGGLIPLWLGGGPLWESMAIAMVFGLAFASLLTLGVLPVLYAVFFRIRKPSGSPLRM